jgi:hypothetical protein
MFALTQILTRSLSDRLEKYLWNLSDLLNFEHKSIHLAN